MGRHMILNSIEKSAKLQPVEGYFARNPFSRYGRKRPRDKGPKDDIPRNCRQILSCHWKNGYCAVRTLRRWIGMSVKEDIVIGLSASRLQWLTGARDATGLSWGRFRPIPVVNVWVARAMIVTVISIVHCPTVLIVESDSLAALAIREHRLAAWRPTLCVGPSSAGEWYQAPSVVRGADTRR